ncbi:MAG TPA: anion permease [Acidimicrobiia bacterium]|jgi:PiT family inorganic phosphate transporter
MDRALVAAIVVATAFNFTNGVHDAADAVATLVATRTAQAGAALAVAVVFTLLGPLVLGAAVADTVGKVVEVPQSQIVAVIGAGVSGALVWNLFSWWRGLPSSSTHALIGGLVGAALAADGIHAVGWSTVGLVLAALVLSPALGFAAGFVGTRGARFGLRRATLAVERPIRGGQWVSSAVLAFAHGANDAAKATGVIVVMLVATQHATSTSAPLWVTLLATTSLALGTAVGGWRIVRTIGMGIFRLRPLDGLVSQTGSAVVVLGASALGAPVSTSQVLASSVAGVGSGQRWHHVHWHVVRNIGVAWLVTVPVCVMLGALALPLWRWVT